MRDLLFWGISKGWLTVVLMICFAFPGSEAFTQSTDRVGDSLIIESELQMQQEDSLTRTPRKAALYAAVLPGLGQIYNQKYWKLPLVYGGIGTFAYFINRNSRYYKDLKSKLIDPDYELKYFDGQYSNDQIESGMKTYKRWRDMSIIGTAAFYVIQIVDATVDAYLFDWDVGEDISLRIEPSAAPPAGPLMTSNSFGLRACISF